jgi:hypothetical protein
MHGALGTGSLAFLERTLIETLQGIVPELNAIGTQLINPVLGMTIKGYHHPKGFQFPGDSRALPRHNCTYYDVDVDISPTQIEIYRFDLGNM